MKTVTIMKEIWLIGGIIFQFVKANTSENVPSEKKPQQLIYRNNLKKETFYVK